MLLFFLYGGLILILLLSIIESESENHLKRHTQENIPAGGLFTGAEKRKNMTGRAVYGGLSNAAYDPCYHVRITRICCPCFISYSLSQRECDTIENINQAVLGEMSRAVASVLYTLAQTTGIETVLGMAS